MILNYQNKPCIILEKYKNLRYQKEHEFCYRVLYKNEEIYVEKFDGEFSQPSSSIVVEHIHIDGEIGILFAKSNFKSYVDENENLHKLDGPAVHDSANDFKEFWIHGKLFFESEYWQEVKNIKQEQNLI